MPEPHKPLKVLNAVELTALVKRYLPGMSAGMVASTVTVALELARQNAVMVVQADAEEHRLHLKYLTAINWTP